MFDNKKEKDEWYKYYIRNDKVVINLDIEGIKIS